MAQFRIKNGLIVDNGGIAVTGSISSTAGITGSFSGSIAGFPTDVSSFSSSLSTRITSTEATASQYVVASGSFSTRTTNAENYISVINTKTGSYATTGSNQFNGSQTVTGSLTATGTIVAQTLVVQTITSSVDFVTGSAKFGSLSSNLHQFTGSVSVSGSITTGISTDYITLNNGNLYRTSGSGYGSVNITGRNVSLQYDDLSTGAITGLLVQSGSGNVGIGTTNPSVKLDINGGIVASVTSSASPASFYNTTNDSLTLIGIRSSGTSTSGVNTGAAAVELVGSADNSVHGRHAWIGAEGVVGSTWRTRLKFKIRGESNTGYTWAGGSEAGTIMTLDGNGYVGIGSSAPTVALDVAGVMKLTNASSVSILLNKNTSSAGASAQLYFHDQGVGKWDLGAFNIGAGGANDFTLYNRSGSLGNALTVLYANNYVGIGTTNPSTELHVKAASSWAEIRIDGASGGGASLEYYSNGTQLGDIYYDTSSNMIIRTGGANERMRIISSGNVGIGTTSPGKKLDVSASDENLLRLQRTGVSARQWDINIKPNFTIGDNTAAADRFTIDTSGNVGIGTTSPSQTASNRTVLTLGQSSATGTAVHNTSINGALTSYWYSDYNNYTEFYSAGVLNFITAGTNIITFTQGSSERMRINSAGNVGIGTTAPTKKLEVNGRVGTPAVVSGNVIVGSIASNIASSPSFILIVDLNDAAGFSLSGKVNAASYTCWNISDIWIKKDYSSTTSQAGITGAYKSGCDFSIVDINYNAGRYIALRFTSNPEIDVLWTGYRLNSQFNSDGTAQVITGATVNSTLASY